MTEEMKPCPFCGSSDVLPAPISAFWGYSVYCNDCGTGGPTVDGMAGEEAAIEAWNERAQSVERVRNALLMAMGEGLMALGVIEQEKWEEMKGTINDEGN